MSRTIFVCKVWHSQLSLLQRNTLNNARLDMNTARLNVKWGQSHSSMKSRSRALVHSARTIITQGLTLPAITASEKCTLMLDNVNCWQTGWTDGRTDGNSNSHVAPCYKQGWCDRNCCQYPAIGNTQPQGFVVEDFTRWNGLIGIDAAFVVMVCTLSLVLFVPLKRGAYKVIVPFPR